MKGCLFRRFGSAAIALMAVAAQASAPDSAAEPWMNNVYTPATNEFAGINQAVVELLQTRDTARFASNITISLEDWKAACPTDKITDTAQSVNAARARNEEAAKALLAVADKLHLDFARGGLTSRSEPVQQISQNHYSFMGPAESLPWEARLEITLKPGFLTNDTNAGEFKIAANNLNKFPGGWRINQGIQWEMIPTNIAGAELSRQLRLLAKAVDYQGWTMKDDPALLKCAEHLVHFIRDGDLAVYEKDLLLTSDLVWKIYQKMDMPHKPSRSDVDGMVASLIVEQRKAAQAVFQQLTDAGIDLKSADIQIKDAAIKQAQSPRGVPSFDDLMGNGFTVKMTVKSDAKAKTGKSLSGNYVLAATQVECFGDEWKIMEGLHWVNFPKGVIDAKTAAAMKYENYVSDHGTLPPQTAAPEIEFTPLNGAKPMKLSDLRGKVVILDFWATWCGPCQEPMAKLQALRAGHPDWADNVAIVPLSIDDTIDVVRKHVNDRGWTNTFNVWAGKGGWESAPAKTFRVRGVPTTYIIDGNGQIVQAGHPAGLDIPGLVDGLLNK